MIGNAKGEVTMQANGETYRLHLGMSVLADLQEQFGDRLEALLQVSANDAKLPDLKVMHAVFLAALQRYHADVANRYLVDDIISQNQGAWIALLQGSAPQPDPALKGKNGGKKTPAG